MLTLPIKKKWFDMILSGEKKEEYREIKPYWTSRFISGMMGFPKEHTEDVQELLRKMVTLSRYQIMFRNGYSGNSPSFTAKITLSIGAGREEWGAEPGREYYVLRILEAGAGNGLPKS